MNRRRSTQTVAALIAVAVVLCAPTELPAQSIDASDAVARARSLEQTGFSEDATSYIRGLMKEDSDLAGNPLLALELARLTDDAAEALDLADLVLVRSHDQTLRSAAYTLRGDFLFATGHYAAAAVEYASAIVQREDSDRTILKQAAALLASGDATTATALYRSALVSAEPDVAAWASVGLGWALLAAGSPSEACTHFEAAAAEHRESGVRAAALMGAATCAEALGELSRTSRFLRTVTAEFPGSFEAVIAADRLRVAALRTPDQERITPREETGSTSTDGAAREAEPATDTTH